MCERVNGKRANEVRVSGNGKNVMFSCPCSSFVVLCFDCHTSPFETLILFVMNPEERERCRANFVNTCSNCSRSSVRSFRVSAHRLVYVDKITVASVNCRGLGNLQKRRAVFHYLREKKTLFYSFFTRHSLGPETRQIHHSGMGFNFVFLFE